MWFLVALFVASLVISTFLAPKPKVTNAVSGKLSDFSFPRASYGSPVPRLYGTVKIKGPNTIWAGDFKSDAIKKKVKTGLFSSKKQTIGFKYYVGFDLAICLGPNVNVRRIWAGNYEIWNGCYDGASNVVTFNYPELFGGQDKNGGMSGTFAIYNGTFDQQRDPYLQAKVDPNIPAYVGVCHIVFRQIYVGNSASIQPIYVEASYFTDGLEIGGCMHMMPNRLDANPVEVLYDLIVNDWANLDVDPAKINKTQWRGIAKTVFNEGNGMSVLVANKSKGGDLAQEILTQINGTLYEDPATGLFDLVLLREDYDIDELPVLDASDIISVSSFSKMLWSDTYNRVRISFTDRANGWKEDSVATAEDFANIRYQGSQRTLEATYNTVYDADLANKLAARELSNANVPLYSMDLKITRLGANLRPGSPFLLSWPKYGIDRMVCRVRKFGLGTLQDGTLTASVVQDEFSVNKTVIAPPTGSPYTPPDYSAKPITQYEVFELPYFLTQVSGLATTPGNGRMAVFAVSPAGSSVGFNAFIVGTPEDAEVLTTAPYTDGAKLVGSIGQFDGFEEAKLPTITISNLTQGDPDAGFPLHTVDGVGVRGGRTLFMLNAEFFAYETYTDNEDGTYTLNNVHRALLDSSWHAHAEGDSLYFFEGQEGFLDDEQPVDTTFEMYLQDIGVSSAYPADAAVRFDVTPKGRANAPLPADYVTVGGDRSAGRPVEAGDPVSVAWRARSRLVDASVIEFEGDPAEADEAGATYRLEVVQDGASILTVDPIASGDEVTFTDAMTGPAILNLYTVVDGKKSFEPAQYPVSIVAADTLKIDGQYVTIDGNGVQFDET